MVILLLLLLMLTILLITVEKVIIYKFNLNENLDIIWHIEDADKNSMESCGGIDVMAI